MKSHLSVWSFMGSVVGRWPQQQVPLMKGCWARAQSTIRGGVGHCTAAAAPYVPSRRGLRKSGFATLLAYDLAGASEPAAKIPLLLPPSSPLIQAAIAAAIAAKSPSASLIFGNAGYSRTGGLAPLGRTQRFFSTSAPNASFSSFLFGKAQSENNKPTDNNIKDSNANKKNIIDNNNSPNTPPVLNKDGKPTITITTPSSGTITLPATSAKIGQTLRRHHAREELLAQSRTFIGRLWIRFKLLFLKQARPITLDDISAVFSWFLVGNIIWILLGTTTFFSLVLFTMNTVFAQEYIAQIVGTLITKETGLTVVFENAIVPHWNNGVISFNKVFVSRRPWRGNHRVQKGSQAAALADAERGDAAGAAATAPLDDGNYTQFDLTIDTISVTLSLSKWMNGGGIVKDVEVHGMRGVVDRTHVHWEPGEDATKYKNVHQTGDFEVENFKMEDVLITLYQPAGFRPFKVSIFNCELPRLRKHWLFYDMLSATNISGTYDNALFTVHPRQLENVSSAGFEAANSTPWKKVNRLRCDGVNIDHLNTGLEGPLGWIESGTVDMMADVMLPNDEQNVNLVQVIREIKDSWKESAKTFNAGRDADDCDKRTMRRKGRNSPATTMSANDVIVEGKPQDLTSQLEDRLFGTTSDIDNNNNSSGSDRSSYVVLDFRVQLNNCKAAVPLFTKDLTYINNALIRPIVAYINSRDTYIPISCQVVKSFADFEGSWTMYDSRLMDDLSTGVYDAFAANIVDDEARALRMRKVGFWSLQLAAQILLLSLGAIA